MKKITSIIVLLLAAFILLTSCSGGQTGKIADIADLEGKTVAALATPLDPALTRAAMEGGLGFKFEDMRFFETFSAAVAALKSEQVDAVFGATITLDFYTSQDDSLSSILVPAADAAEPTTAHMALRAEDAELLANVNAALNEMRQDGTLARLEEEYITGSVMEYDGRDMPRFEGAPTIVVGVGGDTPPLDYVAADGKPAGYNVELLAILGERLQANIEISVTPMASKFPALAAKRIDIFFIHAQNKGVAIMTDTMSQNSGIALSEAYHEATGSGFLVLN